MAIDFAKLPPVLPVTVTRISKDGTATKPLIDWEQYTRDWYQKSVVDLETRLVEVVSETGGNTAAIIEETAARTSADEAFAGQLTSLTTTVNGNTANLSILSASINGVEVKYGVQGYINGVTGGFIFTGILQNDGSVAYNMEFHSNVIIYGNLVVDGTINTSEITNNAVTRASSASGTGVSAMCSIVARAGSTIILIGTVDGSGGQVVAWSSTNDPVRLRRTGSGGGLISEINAVPVAYFRDIGTGGTQYFLLSTTIQGRFVVPDDGTYYFQVRSDSGLGYGASIVALEVAK